MFRAALVLVAAIGITTAPQQSGKSPAPLVTFLNDQKGLGIRWARIPAGTFLMGCVPGDSECDADEKPRHAVTLTRDYWLMTTEVTIEMFRSYASQGHGMPLQPDWTTSNREPVVYVERSSASEFCGWLGGRLPTEAEWERAARGGVDGEKYAWGNDLLTRIAGKMPANISDRSLRRKFPHLEDMGDYDDGHARTAQVGSFPPNRFGLHDMVGNVLEWVWDDYPAPYAVGSVIDPRHSSGPGTQVRGASWNRGSHKARSSARLGDISATRAWDIGLRCARDVAVPPAR